VNTFDRLPFNGYLECVGCKNEFDTNLFNGWDAIGWLVPTGLVLVGLIVGIRFLIWH